MTRQIAEVVIWCLTGGVVIAVVLLIRQQLITASLRNRSAELEHSLRARDEELRYLVEARLPALADSLHHPVPVPGFRDSQLAGTAFAQRCQRVIELFGGVMERANKRADQSAKAALKASMRALQGLANEQQITISDMQDRHDSPEVLRDLLEIDHANSQFGRRAQAIAVLCGSWPGRQRSASPLVDAVRGAKSRIRDYRRIQVRSSVDVAIVSRAVEPVVLAVAELLDNAARHSQPNTTVEVNLQPAHNGVCIVIDDAGVGMDANEVENAAALLSGSQDVDVTRLGDPPQFGFAVVGVLAARYGFSVSVDTRSPYGGVRAVVFLLTALLTQVPDEDSSKYGQGTRQAAPAPGAPRVPLPSSPSPAPAQPDQIVSTVSVEEAVPSPPEPQAEQPLPRKEPGRSPRTRPPVQGSTPGGLPKRRRRQQTAAIRASSQAAPHEDEDTDGRTAREKAERMGAFARGTRSGRAAADDDEGKTQR